MDATLSGETTAQAQKQTTKEYKSPPHALIWFFRKSRDLWKSKYQELQASIKRLKNRVADVTKSREQWKLKAEQTNNQLTVLEAENVSLRARSQRWQKKKRPSRPRANVRLGRATRTLRPAVFRSHGATVRVAGHRLRYVPALRRQRDNALRPVGAVRRNPPPIGRPADCGSCGSAWRPCSAPRSSPRTGSG